MIAPGRASRAGTLLVAAAALALAACGHENPATPEPPPADGIDVSAAALVTAEGGAPASFDVVLRSRPEAPVEVEVESEDPTEGLVLAPGHAAFGPRQSITFTPEDWDVPRRVSVDPLGDGVVDGTVRYRVALSVAYTEAAAYAGVAGAAVTVTNVDADTRAIRVGPRALVTSESGASASFAVSLASDPGQTVAVVVESTDTSEGWIRTRWGEPTSSVILWFDAATWSAPQPVAVEGATDGIADGDRTYAVTLRTTFLPPGDPWASVPVEQVEVTNLDAP